MDTSSLDPIFPPVSGRQVVARFDGGDPTSDAGALPLLLYVTGPDGMQRLVSSMLRPGRAGWSLGLFGLLRRAIRVLRKKLPGVRIVLWADAGFGYRELIDIALGHHTGSGG